MKKLVLSLLVLLLVTGCSSTPKPTVEPTSTPEATVESTDSPATTDEVVDYKVGVWQDSNYESETLGFRFTLPEGWKVESSDAQQAILDKGAEVLETEKTEDAILEFLITSEDPKLNIQAMSSNVGPLAKTLSNAIISETLKTQLEGVEGFAYEILEEGTTKIGNEEYGFISMHETNYDLYQKIYFRIVGEYMFNLTVSTEEASKQAADDFVSSIQPY